MRLVFMLTLFLFSQITVANSGAVGNFLSKARNSKAIKTVVNKAMNITGAAIIVCSPFIAGCGDQRGRVVIDDVVREDASYAGKYAEFVEFEIDGQQYFLYIEETDTGELLVEYDDDYGRLIFLQQSIGEFVPNHQDIGRDAYFTDVINGRDVYLDGAVVDVTDNDYYVIEVYQHTDVDTGAASVYVRSFKRLAHKSLLLEDGGFEFYDE